MINNDWITVVFVIVLLLLAVAKWLYKDRLLNLSTLFFSKDYFLNYGKENQLIFNGFNAILFTIQSIVLGLLILGVVVFYKPELLEMGSLELFLKSTLLVTIFFLIRYLIGKILAIIFEVNRLQEYIAFAKISYFFNSILWILPFVLSIFYIEKHNLLMFQLTMVIFTILLIVRYVLIARNNKNSIFYRLFYFILYLCALEIAPVLLLYKIVA